MQAIPSVIISIFTIFLYTALGVYVLAKNPHERTNKVFTMLMLAFILWSMGTYNLGLIAEDASLKEVVFYMRLQLSGVILSLTTFVFFALALTKTQKAFKNPFTYLVIIPSLFLLYLVWTSDVSTIEQTAFSTIKGTKPELFLFSTIFGMAGIYLLFRHYMTSKYRERGQTKLVLTGAITAILTAVTINIILPMFFGVYFLALSTLAPAVMGIFFVYAIYQYGLFIRPMPELSPTSFCGVECTLCPKYLNDECLGCRFDRERYRNCQVYKCIIERGYKDCGFCPEIIECIKRKETPCFSNVPGMETLKYNLEPGKTYFVERDGYTLFLKSVKCGAFGLVATTTPPEEIKEKYSLATTPIAWISEEAGELGIKPTDVKHLSVLLINFMKKIGNAVVLIDGIDTLIMINGFDRMKKVIHILNSIAQTTNSILIIPTKMDDESLNSLKDDIQLNNI